MAKVFYDHLIIIEEVITILDAHHLDSKDREKLLELVDRTMHHTILDTILTHLPQEYHKEFLIKLHAAPGSPTLILYLQEHTKVDIENEILKSAQKVKKILLQEIEKATKKMTV